MTYIPGIDQVVRASALSLAAAGLLAAPTVATVNIPEGGAVPADSLDLIHFRVLDGCDGEATDAIEVRIPDAVRNVIPASVPGWTVEVETVDGDGEAMAPAELADDEEVSLVRWTGGPLPDGEYMDFGMRVHFPDEVGASLAFPVTQTCGLTSVMWDGDKDADNAAPRVTIGDHVSQRELGDIEDTVRALSEEVASLSEQLQGVNPSNIQRRMAEAESVIDQRFPQIIERLDRLADRIQALEDAATADDAG